MSKAYYTAQPYAASIAEGLWANMWFSVSGWQNSGLLNPDLSLRPAYTAYQFARNELRDASFTREIIDFAGVKGMSLTGEAGKPEYCGRWMATRTPSPCRRFRLPPGMSWGVRLPPSTQ